MSGLANIDMFVLEFGVFFVLLGLFCVVRVVCLCASLFPLISVISVISVPSMGSECELTVKEAAVKATRKGDTVNINTELCGEFCSLCVT